MCEARSAKRRDGGESFDISKLEIDAPQVIEDQDPRQVTLLPESLDDFIPGDNVASIVDALVDDANLQSLGFDTATRALLAGWLIALMAWMLPSARSARFFVILLLTYVVALCSLPHVVAGSVESAYAVLTGAASIRQYAGDFLLPTLIGNTVGGVALVAMLNHAPLADELKPDRSGEDADSPG